MGTRNIRTRVVAILSVMLAFAAMIAVAPASAARSTVVGTPGSAVRQDMGKVSLFVYDANTATKSPIAKAQVVVHNEGVIELQGWTDENGRFSGMLKEGTYNLNVSADSYKSATLEFVVKSGWATDLEAAMDKEVALGKLAVSVWDASGSSDLPVAGATVFIYNSLGVLVAKGLTDKSGLYATELPSDLYTVLIEADGYVSTKAEALVKAGEATELKVEVKK